MVFFVFFFFFLFIDSPSEQLTTEKIDDTAYFGLWMESVWIDLIKLGLQVDFNWITFICDLHAIIKGKYYLTTWKTNLESFTIVLENFNLERMMVRKDVQIMLQVSNWIKIYMAEF